MEDINQPTPTNQPSQPNLILNAVEAANRLRIENERMEANIKKIQELKSEQILSGVTYAGQVPPEQKPESASDYMKRVMSGALNGKPKETID